MILICKEVRIIDANEVEVGKLIFSFCGVQPIFPTFGIPETP
jgi:hypothetical protein